MGGVNEEWGFHTISDIHKKSGSTLVEEKLLEKCKRNWKLPHVIILLFQTH
jgi:hypothetical protein